MGKVIKKIWFIAIVLLVFSGCSKNLAPTVVPANPGEKVWKVRVKEIRRKWIAFRYKRKTERLTRKAKSKSEKLKRKDARAEKKLAEQHMKNQHPEVQERMKQSQKEAEKNRTKRTLRQRLRLWLWKFK
ncbi:MAG: hypothetical protein PWR03_941 [Tenuifilum sp.]|uniref:hypothetical protein n=1 Tax=Tenuifilum sp. TaxID=2760880 RepID=UPI0024AA2568|nr:hypothetical protein [Tenuifilum sp.]MDI3526758.1 hypothetical protein [Tenuifilum sp.]